MTVTEAPFGKTPAGKAVSLYTLKNANGMRVQLTNYGAIVVRVDVPDRAGKMANVNLGFDSLDGYLRGHPFFGATVGRYCNRIAQGRFTLDGREYTLATNNGPNHLHGGEVGFDKVVWTAEKIENPGQVGIKFTHRSPDGDEGYPGNLDVIATYALNDANELSVEFTAVTDQATPVNLTNHCYWNLGGAGTGKILDHELTIHAQQYLPVDETLIPTGEVANVAGTPLDFRQPQAMGKRLSEVGADPVGYDHCYVLPAKDGQLLRAARVRDPQSGRVMEVLTTQPGMQFYTGNFLSGSEADGGFGQHAGFCLETQHYPDAPNKPEFPSTILRPGETFQQRTVHRFSVE